MSYLLLSCKLRSFHWTDIKQWNLVISNAFVVINSVWCVSVRVSRINYCRHKRLDHETTVCQVCPLMKPLLVSDFDAPCPSDVIDLGFMSHRRSVFSLCLHEHVVCILMCFGDKRCYNSLQSLDSKSKVFAPSYHKSKSSPLSIAVHLEINLNQ